MTITLSDEAVEAGAKAIHDHWQGGHSHSRSWAQTVEKLPGQANDFRAKARAAITAYLDALVASGRAQESSGWIDGDSGYMMAEPTMPDDSASDSRYFPVLIIRIDGDK